MSIGFLHDVSVTTPRVIGGKEGIMYANIRGIHVIWHGRYTRGKKNIVYHDNLHY